jgi:hypothetical protein
MLLSFRSGNAASVRTRSIASVLVLAAITGQSSALGITASYDATILANPAAKATLDQLVSDYNAKFSDTTAINISFGNMGSGLGQSNTSYFQWNYSDYLAALTAHKMSADDTAALAQIAADPFTASTKVWVTTALSETLGLTTYAGTDSTISLNLGLCFTGHTTPEAGKYDLYSVAAHELDEALGTSSGVDSTIGGNGGPFAADVFRYDGSGGRSFTNDTTQHAWFSIDGTTNLVEYNQFGRTTGDWGDWVIHNPGQTQDWAGTPGVVISPGSNEFRLLDVVGYNTTAVPEPGTFAALGLGALVVLRRRRSR